MTDKGWPGLPTHVAAVGKKPGETARWSYDEELVFFRVLQVLAGYVPSDICRAVSEQLAQKNAEQVTNHNAPSIRQNWFFSLQTHN